MAFNNEMLSYFANKMWNKNKNTFVSKETGKSLSTNDYTNEDKNKLNNLSAETTSYDNTTSGLSATNVQGAIDEINTGLSDKSDLIHNHDDRYYTETEIDNKLSTKSDSSHTHDSIYYTKSDVYTKTETDNKLSTKSDSSHTHDGSYYTKTEIDNKLSGKSDTSHNHNSSYYTKTEIDNKLSDLPTNAESTTYSNTASGLSSTNVQGAIDEINTEINELANKVIEYHAKVMTVVIDQSNSNPSTCITYADDAVGMTPGSSEWDSFFGHYPCLLKNGVEVGRLNPNDFTKFEDGTSADITSGNAGDVMIAFPKLGYKISTSGDIVTVSMTDNPNADGYCYLAHTRGTTVKDKFYLGAYKGYTLDSKLRSLSGKTPTVKTTIGNFRTYAQANGSGYDQSAFNQLIFRQCMYLLKYKNLDSQTAVGYGYANGNSSAVSTGGTNAKGMDYGETTGKLQMKLFGLEDFWGNVNEFIDGIFSDSNRNIFTATENFNDTESGYTNQGASGLSSNTSKYISKVQGTSEKGFVLKEASGSSTTYYSDLANVYASSFACFGGEWNNGTSAGAFRLNMSRYASGSYSNVSARLMYL